MSALRIAVLAAWVLLLPASASAYRTAGELPEYEGTMRVRWEADDLGFQVNETLPRGVSLSELTRAAELGFAAWSDPGCTVLETTPGGTTTAAARPGDGRVTVQFLRTWADRGFAPDAAATTDISYQRGADGRWRIIDADILLNEQGFAWAIGSGGDTSRRDVQAVITHEAGHVLGLLHPCEPGGADGAPACGSDPAYRDTTMYPIYTGEAQRNLSSDDEAGVCFLYPPGGCEVTGCPSGMECTAGVCRSTCLGEVCAADEVCTASGCAPSRSIPSSPELAAAGDPCSDSVECASAYCSTGGYCTVPCLAGGECPQGYACAEADAFSECRPEAGVFAAGCSRGEQCLSGLCLTRSNHASICTRHCGETLPLCPDDHDCTAVDGQQVCVPHVASGCSATPSRPRQPISIPLLFIAVVGVLQTTRRGAQACRERRTR